MSDLIDKKALLCAMTKKAREECMCSLKASLALERLGKRIQSGEFDAKPEHCIAPSQGYCNRLIVLEKRVEQIERSEYASKIIDKMRAWCNPKEPVMKCTIPTKKYICTSEMRGGCRQHHTPNPEHCSTVNGTWCPSLVEVT